MVSKKLLYDTNGLPYDVYMGDSRPQCSSSSYQCRPKLSLSTSAEVSRLSKCQRKSEARSILSLAASSRQFPI